MTVLSEQIAANEDQDITELLTIGYGVIYSIDIDRISDLERPPGRRRKNSPWHRTEKESKSDYGIEGWKHEKWCTYLTQEQFDEFIDHVSICAEHTETMGSLGAPSPDGIILGCMPAICFECGADDCILQAYVTPYVLSGEFEGPFDDDDWQAMRTRLIEKYK